MVLFTSGGLFANQKQLVKDTEEKKGAEEAEDEEETKLRQEMLQQMQAEFTPFDKVVKIDAKPIFCRDDFDFGYKIGAGKFGRVYLCRERRTNLVCAIKVVHKQQLMKHHLEHQIIREIEIQTHLRHPNILQLYTFFWDDHQIYMVTEMAHGGELYRRLTKSKNFSEARASWYMRQMVHAISYCHAKHVIHRDIKPENILVGPGDMLKISDFGWAAHYVDSSKTRQTFCGTPDYIPPEMLSAATHGFEVDIWGLGVLLFEFMVGRPPFEDQQRNVTYKRIQGVNIRWPDVNEPQLTANARDLIQKCLRKDPRQRITCDQMARHPFLNWDTPDKQRLKASFRERYGGLETPQKWASAASAYALGSSPIFE